MGVVYEAQHVHLGRTVALKLLAPELSESADFRARFLRESRLAATIEHPGIVTVYDAGEVNGVLYIAMRYVRGVNLATMLAQRGSLTPAETVSFLGQVATALDAAHGAGLVHRDVKPANVMIEGDRCYLTDFGLTKRTMDESAALTAAGQFLGTVDYIAPEQIEGRPIDGRADVYALGCVLFECLTGTRPYPRDSQIAVIYAQLREPPPRATEMRPELPPAIDAVVERAMAKATEARYPTCAELVTAARLALPAASRASGSAGPVQGAGPPTAPWPPPDTPAPTPLPATALRPGAPPPVTAPKPGVDLPTAPAPPPPAGGADLPTAPLPASAHAAAPAQPPPPGRPARRRSALVPIAVVAVLAAAVAGIAIALSGGSSKTTGASQPTSSGGPPTVGPHVAGTPIKVGQQPVGIVERGSSLWIADNAAGEVIRLTDEGRDPKAIKVGQGPYDMASNKTSVWVANSGSNSVTRIDTASGKASRQFPVRAKPLFLTAEDDFVYVANSGDDSVSVLDARTGGSVDTIPVGKDPRGIAAASGVAWVTNYGSDTVSRIENGRVTDEIPVGHNPVGIAARPQAIWVANEGSDTVTRIEVGSGRKTVTDVGREPYAVGSQVNGYIWVVNRGEGTVMRLDPGTGKRVGEAIPVPGEPVSMAGHKPDLWVTASGAGTLSRIRP
jgi:YVTN family beta-propeller protein